MKLEVMRAMAVEKQGLKFQYAKFGDDGKTSLSSEKTVKAFPYIYSIPINAENAEQMKALFERFYKSDKDLKRLEDEWKKLNAKSEVSNFRMFDWAKVTIPQQLGDTILNEEIKVSRIYENHNRDMFSYGKFSEENGLYVLNQTYVHVAEIRDILDDEVFRDFDRLYADVDNPEFLVDVKHIKEAPVATSSERYHLQAFTPKRNEEVRNAIKKIHDALAEKIKNPTEEMKTLLGHYKYILARTDVENGNLLEAFEEKSYLNSLNAVFAYNFRTSRYPMNLRKIMFCNYGITSNTCDKKSISI